MEVLEASFSVVFITQTHRIIKDEKDLQDHQIQPSQHISKCCIYLLNISSEETPALPWAAHSNAQPLFQGRIFLLISNLNLCSATPNPIYFSAQGSSTSAPDSSVVAGVFPGNPAQLFHPPRATRSSGSVLWGGTHGLRMSRAVVPWLSLLASCCWSTLCHQGLLDP